MKRVHNKCYVWKDCLVVSIECFMEQHTRYLGIMGWGEYQGLLQKEPSWQRGKPVLWSALVIRWLCVFWRPEQSLRFSTAYIINLFVQHCYSLVWLSLFSPIAKRFDDLGCGVLLMKISNELGEVGVCVHADICQITLQKYPAWPSVSLSITHTPLTQSFSQALLVLVSPQWRNVFAVTFCCGVEIQQKFRDLTLHTSRGVVCQQSWGWRSGFQSDWNWRQGRG